MTSYSSSDEKFYSASSELKLSNDKRASETSQITFKFSKKLFKKSEKFFDKFKKSSDESEKSSDKLLDEFFTEFFKKFFVSLASSSLSEFTFTEVDKTFIKDWAYRHEYKIFI